MEATKATIYLVDNKIQVDEAAIAAINAAIAHCPVMDNYNEDKILANRRLQLVATLTIKAEKVAIE